LTRGIEHLKRSEQLFYWRVILDGDWAGGSLRATPAEGLSCSGKEWAVIVTGAQGQQVNDPMRAMVLLSALGKSPSITLGVIRNGAPLQLYYTIY
jgi:hypothetical protein